MSAKSLDRLQSVIDHNLCNRCGTCVGLSNGAIQFTDRTGKFLPAIIQEPSDDVAELLWKACPGGNFDFPGYRRQFYPETTPFHTYTGPYQQISIGFSNDPVIRRSSASGGILSAILIWMLDKKMIEGAVVTGMSETEPWLAKTFIATSREEILSASQSKYIITSVNEILPEIQAFNGRLAYVGLPGQVQSIRKLQALKHPSVENIKYIFGPFYGNTLHFSSVSGFLRSYGEKDYTQIKHLYFRHGEWPGNMRVEMKNGRVIELPKFHANYLIPFHILKNSLLCTDLSNEFTDISGGDAWAPTYEERGKGFSMVISRSLPGEEILKLMQADGAINIQPVDLNEAITMHSHGYDLKKRGSFIRIRFRKMLGLAVPDYGYRLKDFPMSRYFMELVILSLFLVLGTAPARWLVERISPSWIGKIFEKSRTIWKKSTYRIKRNNLES
ncbi:MAG: Coenzyme F420 hydrogenase/dehydrogenase, beta subunit C-terminal domain [Bacteroidales bacterium]|nr:Coenzyme F420 hydrogenase/dehydrogenase, beta subunit C-terminal domain [Bacteroidales bacterium]